MQYAWGSLNAIPNYCGWQQSNAPVAELWFGAHSMAPSGVILEDGSQIALDAFVENNAENVLGDDIITRYGRRIPYLVKIIAPEQCLSLQVHPNKQQAETGWESEEELGISLADPTRNFADPYHKPELLYALSEFHALCGFRAPRKILSVLANLNSKPIRRIKDFLQQEPNQEGLQKAFASLFASDTRPSLNEIKEIAQLLENRLKAHSPSNRADKTVVNLAKLYPNDPAVIATLLLNPVTIHPGEVIFVSPGTVHAYMSGIGIEVMAPSDNVARCGLTNKYVDLKNFMQCANYQGAPPVRIAPEINSFGQEIFYAPVDDFQIAICPKSDQWKEIPGVGVKIVISLEGKNILQSSTPLKNHLANKNYVSNQFHLQKQDNALAQVLEKTNKMQAEAVGSLQLFRDCDQEGIITLEPGQVALLLANDSGCKYLSQGKIAVVSVP